jgi:hypothetical protein
MNFVKLEKRKKYQFSVRKYDEATLINIHGLMLPRGWMFGRHRRMYLRLVLLAQFIAFCHNFLVLN